MDIEKVNESLRSKGANKASDRDAKLASVNKSLRMKSPAGKKAALDAIENQPKPVAKTQPAKPAAIQQPKVRLNIPELVAALSGIRSRVGALIAVSEQDSAKGAKETLAICKALLAIEQLLK